MVELEDALKEAELDLAPSADPEWPAASPRPETRPEPKRNGVKASLSGVLAVAVAFAVTVAAAFLLGPGVPHFDLSVYAFLGVIYVATLETTFRVAGAVHGGP